MSLKPWLGKIYGTQRHRGVVVTNTAQLHSAKPNSGPAQVQILIMTCRVSGCFGYIRLSLWTKLLCI